MGEKKNGQKFVPMKQFFVQANRASSTQVPDKNRFEISAMAAKTSTVSPALGKAVTAPSTVCPAHGKMYGASSSSVSQTLGEDDAESEDSERQVLEDEEEGTESISWKPF